MTHEEYLARLKALIDNSEIKKEGHLLTLEEGIEEIIQCFLKKKREGGRIFFIGNGGSAAIAGHMTADYMKNGGMCTVNLYDNALTTCMGNDYGYEYVFSKPLSFLAESKDLLVAISSSGRSENIIRAIEIAREANVTVITLTGFKPDNPARDKGDFSIYVPAEHYGMVESIHNLFLQQIVDAIIERDGAAI